MYVCSNGIKTAVILQDMDPLHPRRDHDNITKMVCWHSRYNLGDKHEYKEPRDFAVDMVEKYLTQKDVFRAMADGILKDFRLIDNGDNGDYSVESRIAFGPGKGTWERMDWKVSREFEVVEDPETTFDLEYDVLDNCWPDEMLRAVVKYGDVAIQPLFLYDHSVQSISTGSFVGRAQHAEWDSGQVGYIYLDKETAMREMCIEAETLRIARITPENERELVSYQVGPKFEPMDVGEFLKIKRFEQVEKAEHIRNLKDVCWPGTNRPVIDEATIRGGFLFKKDHTLYTLQSASRDNGVQLLEVATFNPDLKKLTEENWKARAAEVLEADVLEYDNYLTGEVYGYQLFEGLDEVESCWGFNPGKERIEDLMNAELRVWFGSKMDFEFDSGDEFDIEEYFEENDFPELRGEIRKAVETQLHHTAQQAERDHEDFPYAVSYEDICWNKDGVLEDVIESLYEEHQIPSEERIHEAFQEHAGLSRTFRPKITVNDLDPTRDYTIEELAEIVRSKEQGQVDRLIADANNRVDLSKNLGRENEIEM